jgi:hypothetical protein
LDAWIELSPSPEAKSGSLIPYDQRLPDPVKKLFELARQTIDQAAGSAQWDLAIRIDSEQCDDLMHHGIFGSVYHHELGDEYCAFVSYEGKSYKVALFITK